MCVGIIMLLLWARKWELMPSWSERDSAVRRVINFELFPLLHVKGVWEWEKLFSLKVRNIWMDVFMDNKWNFYLIWECMRYPKTNITHLICDCEYSSYSINIVCHKEPSDISLISFFVKFDHKSSDLFCALMCSNYIDHFSLVDLTSGLNHSITALTSRLWLTMCCAKICVWHFHGPFDTQHDDGMAHMPRATNRFLFFSLT